MAKTLLRPYTAWENHSPFDLVVLDIVLPHADGNYVLEEIRDYEESNEVGPEQRIAVLITTGHENYENFKRAYSAGYQGFIPKPIDRANVVALLKNCLLYTSPSPRDLARSRMPSSA